MISSNKCWLIHSFVSSVPVRVYEGPRFGISMLALDLRTNVRSLQCFVLLSHPPCASASDIPRAPGPQELSSYEALTRLSPPLKDLLATHVG